MDALFPEMGKSMELRLILLGVWAVLFYVWLGGVWDCWINPTGYPVLLWKIVPINDFPMFGYVFFGNIPKLQSLKKIHSTELFCGSTPAFQF